MPNTDSYVRRLPADESFWKKPLRLGYLRMELTERCNNDCIHCLVNLPLEDERAKATELNTSAVQRVLDQASALGCLKVNFTGGEPLLRHDMKELYAYARELGLIIVLFTNGRLLDESWMEIFKENPPGHPVDLTTYGMTSVTYDRVVRRGGAFEEFNRGIDLLRRNRIPFTVRMAVLNENKSEADAYQQWIRSMGNQPEPILVTNLSLRVRRDSQQRNDRIRQQRIPADEVIRLLYSDGNSPKFAEDFCRQFAGAKGASLFHCGMGESVAVDAYGKLYGCLLLRHPELTFDLNSGTMQQALDAFFPVQTMRKSENPQYMERCAKCSLYGFCEQCPAQAYMENGTLDTPVEYLCNLAHAQAERLGLIPSGKKAWLQ
jgi:radical SAM protein with 4Fe4S-binding SPASM domain